MNRAEKKIEAVKRMRALNILAQPINEFEKEDKLNLSEHGGMLYWLKDEEQAMVKKFEDENNAVVYHVIKNCTDIGVMYALLFVSDYDEEWEMDNADLADGRAFAYVVNVNTPEASEFGTIGIEPSFGGLKRTW